MTMLDLLGPTSRSRFFHSYSPRPAPGHSPFQNLKRTASLLENSIPQPTAIEPSPHARSIASLLPPNDRLIDRRRRRRPARRSRLYGGSRSLSTLRRDRLAARSVWLCTLRRLLCWWSSLPPGHCHAIRPSHRPWTTLQQPPMHLQPLAFAQHRSSLRATSPSARCVPPAM